MTYLVIQKISVFNVYNLLRYVLLDYATQDGSMKDCFIFVSPSGIKPELQMLYASSKLEVVNEVDFFLLKTCREIPTP